MGRITCRKAITVPRRTPSGHFPQRDKRGPVSHKAGDSQKLQGNYILFAKAAVIGHPQSHQRGAGAGPAARQRQPQRPRQPPSPPPLAPPAGGRGAVSAPLLSMPAPLLSMPAPPAHAPCGAAVHSKGGLILAGWCKRLPLLSQRDRGARPRDVAVSSAVTSPQPAKC